MLVGVGIGHCVTVVAGLVVVVALVVVGWAVVTLVVRVPAGSLVAGGQVVVRTVVVAEGFWTGGLGGLFLQKPNLEPPPLVLPQ